MNKPELLLVVKVDTPMAVVLLPAVLVLKSKLFKLSTNKVVPLLVVIPVVTTPLVVSLPVVSLQVATPLVVLKKLKPSK